MKAHFRARRDKLRLLLQKRGLDALLVTYDANRYYLSGFELHDSQGNESSGCLIVCADGRDYLATDPRFEEAAGRLLSPEEIVLYRQDYLAVIKNLLKKCGVRIACETATLSYKTLVALSSKSFSLVPGDALCSELRVIKDPFEIEALEKSFALNHAMLAWLERELIPGRSEQDISWSIERYFREHGASELAFPNIVAIADNAAMPHAIPSSRTITNNSLVLVDVGCRVDAYCSDQTRTFWVGEAPEERFSTTVRLVREAQQRAIDSMRPGVVMRDIYAEACAVFARAGVAEYFTHGLGHGVGLETHERPSLNSSSTGVLEPGMVVTVEPGLYYPGWGGVRWEVTVLVEENSVRVL